ncbi:MAG: hypothetical protein JWP57_4284 [Spirosoma sp.]|nr:hypothetical protein [Spirosoma sp.]
MFFAKITNSHNSRNRLTEYVGKQVKQLECQTVEDPAAFGNHLEQLVHRANLKFPRCHPLRAYLRKSHTEGDYSAGVNEVVQFSLYAQRGVFKEVQGHIPITPNEGQQATLFTD